MLNANYRCVWWVALIAKIALPQALAPFLWAVRFLKPDA